MYHEIGFICRDIYWTNLRNLRIDTIVSDIILSLVVSQVVHPSHPTSTYFRISR